MELLFNELSLHGQFESVDSFKSAINRLIKIKNVAQRYGRRVSCNQKIVQTQVTSNINFVKAVNLALNINERRALMQWLTRTGPFWGEDRIHTEDDWFEVDDQVVTDTSIGEAAARTQNGFVNALISLDPSTWLRSPIEVSYLESDLNKNVIPILNYWDSIALETHLDSIPSQIESWQELENATTNRFKRLIFARESFHPLRSCPFVFSAAQRLLVLFDTLDRFAGAFNELGERTEEGQRIYQNFFTGKKGKGGMGAVFSDSSEQEKTKFNGQLTFPHPLDKNEELFCPWHGKIQTPPLRFHFNFPIRYNEPVHVLYVGPKITKS